MAYLHNVSGMAARRALVGCSISANRFAIASPRILALRENAVNVAFPRIYAAARLREAQRFAWQFPLADAQSSLGNAPACAA
ncbi:MAG TPA: hypothetical protein VH105_19555 [Burkholderiales bacterium]|jgi:hypothetical protein|nr:hypothetical protein [Burkholderiales bacterium]